MKRKLNQSGFSLVELMVVVAIIGILATIAIPKVNKFIAKARQSEAQVNLTSLYTFNKNFFVEFQGYSSSFGALGFQPEGKLRYATGWAATSGICPTQFTLLKGAAACTNSSSTLDICPAALGGSCTTLPGANNQQPTVGAGSAIAADFSTFTSSAQANLISSAPQPDLWTINQDKNLQNVKDGTQ